MRSHAARLLLPLVTCAAVLARADSETCAAEGEGACEAEATYPVAKTAFVLTSALGSVGECIIKILLEIQYNSNVRKQSFPLTRQTLLHLHWVAIVYHPTFL